MGIGDPLRVILRTIAMFIRTMVVIVSDTRTSILV